MEKKHTPGPWEVDEQGMIYQCDSPDDDAKLICDCAQDPITGPTEEELANAALIAAAPELLAALELFLRMDWRIGPENHEYDIARAAIAKAKGGAQ